MGPPNDREGNPSPSDPPGLPRALSLVPEAEDLPEAPSGGGLARDPLPREELVSALAATARHPILSVGLDGRITGWNPGAERLFGYSWLEAVGRPLTIVLPPGRLRDDAEILRLPLAGQRVDGFETAWLTKPGALVDLALSLAPIRRPGGRVVGTSVSVADGHGALDQAELRRSVRALERGFDNTLIASALTTDDGRFVDVNESLCELLGYSRAQLLQRSFPDLTYAPDFSEERAYLHQVRDGSVQAYHLHKRYLDHTGEPVWVSQSCSAVPRDRLPPERLFLQMEDIHGRKLEEERLVHLALHDPLTDLPNRTVLMDRLGQALARSQRAHQLVAVLFIDLDNFKVINDELGHEFGDRVLVRVADQLQEITRPQDTVARLGGDEFVMLCEDVTSHEAVLAIAERVRETLGVPGHPADAVITASVGVALAVGSRISPDALLGLADTAMYRAKAMGGGRVELSDRAPRTHDTPPWSSEDEWRAAIEQDQLRLVYQPQVRLDDGSVVGVEALLRWDHPQRGQLLPRDFLQDAEETDLIVPMGRWVLEHACQQAAIWQERSGAAPLRMSVNVAARELLQRDFVRHLATTLSAAGLPPQSLCLELGEGPALSAARTEPSVLENVASLGVRLGIDGFGSGASSVRILRELPISFLKIDQSLVQRVCASTEDAAVVRAMVHLADDLHLQSVAQGVETPEQARGLRAAGCAVAQGFLLGKPVAAAAIGDHVPDGVRVSPLEWHPQAAESPAPSTT